MRKKSITNIDPTTSESIDKILKERYYVKKSDGSYETWDEMCTRIGNTLEAQEPFNQVYTREDLIDALKYRKIMFGSPTIMNAGARLGMLSSCFIFEVKDSLGEIFNTVAESAKTFKHGGGIGYDWSDLRPEGDLVNTTGGTSSGPLSFMSVIDKTGEVVKGGGLRKAAIMSTLRIDHPDIEKFINIKRTEHELNNMNLSVTVTDEFMNAMVNDLNFDLRFNGKVYKTMKAKELWDQIVDAAHKSAEPGVIFIDRVNEYNTTPAYGPITHPNPCSEFFQVHWNSCNLGSINLMECYDEQGNFDYKELGYLTRLMTTALNKTIEVNNFPTEKIATTTRKLRPIGIGIFGLANVFIKEKIQYGSKESCLLLEKILDVINKESLDLSADYAKVFNKFDTYEYKNLKFVHEREQEPDWEATINKIKEHGLYNCLTTTFMPTGTVSILAGQGEANGVEPLYSTKVIRKFVNKQGNLEDMEVYAPAVQNWFQENPGKELPNYIVTKDNLTPHDHIMILASAQKHCQTGVSKTINFPFNATRADIASSMLKAYEYGCKSVSIYRDGSRAIQILNSDTEIEEVVSPIKYMSNTENREQMFFVVKRQKNGKIVGILTKDSSGCLVTAGLEALKCKFINRQLDLNVSLDRILNDLLSMARGSDLPLTLYEVLNEVHTKSSKVSKDFIKQIELSPQFISCPTGACSL